MVPEELLTHAQLSFSSAIPHARLHEVDGGKLQVRVPFTNSPGDDVPRLFSILSIYLLNCH